MTFNPIIDTAKQFNAKLDSFVDCIMKNFKANKETRKKFRLPLKIGISIIGSFVAYYLICQIISWIIALAVLGTLASVAAVGILGPEKCKEKLNTGLDMLRYGGDQREHTN